MSFFQAEVEREQAQQPAKRAVIYARYSSEMQDTSDSIEVQIAECKKYALSQDIVIVREPFVDRAETGTSTENRRAYQELLALAQGPECDFDIILTFHTSRWGRGIESEIDEHRLEKNGVKVIAVSQPVTADEAVESQFMKGILRKIDAYYSLQTSKFTHAFQSSNARNGFRNGGPPPDGYTVKYIPTGKKDRQGEEKMKTQLVLDEKPGKHDLTDRPRSEMIQLAFQQMYTGKGLRSVARTLRERGWRNRYAPRPVSLSTIRMWLTNPTYTGFMAWNRVKFFRRDGKRSYRPNPLSKWIYSEKPAHPAIVDKGVFEAVAVKFLRRDGRLGGRPCGTRVRGPGLGRDSARYLLSGLLHCGACGASYVAVKTTHRGKSPIVSMGCNARERWGRKECESKRVNMGLAEGVVLDALLNRLLTEETIQQFVEAFNKATSNPRTNGTSDARGAQTEIARVEAEIARMKQAILKGVDPTTFVEELAERQSELRRLLTVAAPQESVDSPRLLRFDSQRHPRWVRDLRKTMLSCDFETRRVLIHRMIRKIVIAADRSAKLTWDLPATLALSGDQQVPSAAEQLESSSRKKGITKMRCGGTQRVSYPETALPSVRLRLVPAGPRRWPFGYEVLRSLA